MTTPADLRKRLKACPAGKAGWKEFEDVCIDTLVYLFVPPLTPPKIQPRSYSGIDRRDAVFPNRTFTAENNWGRLYQELSARLILFEFKNYDKEDIGKDETNQTRNYLTKALGKLAVMCCNRTPNHAAHLKRNTVYSEDEKVILFITTADLLEMIDIKERGEDPSDFIVDLVEEFYMQHE